MKPITLMVLACLVSSPLIAQTLPDEINAAPYESRYQSLSSSVNGTATQLSAAQNELAEARKFMSDMTAFIQRTHQKIAQTQHEINQHRQAIPALQQEIGQIRQEITRTGYLFQQRQNDLQQIEGRIQHQIRVVRPLEALLERKEARLRELQAEVANMNRIEREIAARVEKSQAEGKSLDGRIQEEQALQRKLKAEMANTGAAVAQAEGAVRLAESELATLKNNIEIEKGKLAALTVRTEEARMEMIRLGQSDAPMPQVEAARQKFISMNAMKEKLATVEIPALEAALPAQVSKIAKLKAAVEVARQGDPTIPAKIAESEKKESGYITRRNVVTQEIDRAQKELYAQNRLTEQKEAHLKREQDDMRGDSIAVARERNLLINLQRDAEAAKADLAGLSQRSAELNRAGEARDIDLRNRSNAIPTLESSIRTDQKAINDGQAELNRVGASEEKLEADVNNISAQLSKLTAERDAAQAQRDQRAALYNRHLEDAADLGANQATAATGLGSTAGEKSAVALGKQNGSAVGRELGVAEGKLWGSTRGELQGYELGYKEGLASTADINQAQADGESRGIKDADLHANTNLKPAFFEEELLSLFKQPLTPAQKKNLQMLKQLQTTARAGSADPITQSEIQASNKLVTPLDQSIAINAKDLKNVQDKAKRLSDAGEVFSAPSQIPTGAANCSQVYKGIAAFKAACDRAYKENFSGLYVEAMRESFVDGYGDVFMAALRENNESSLEATYPVELASAVKVSRAEGLRVGKVEIYRSTFDRVYKAAYADHLPKATARVRGEAQAELASLRQTKPLLTLASKELKYTELRGGEEVTLATAIKNVSDVKFDGPVVIRITTAYNADVPVSQIVLNGADARAITALPELKFKVSANARRGQEMVIGGVIDLPGDLYKPSRKETFQIREMIGANVAHTIASEYDATPSIKELFGRKKNSLKVKLAPTVEDLAEGFSLSLNAVGDNANLVTIADKDIETGAVFANQVKEYKFTYTFADQAKKKTITMELVLSYGGKVLKKELITVNPK